MLLPYLGSTPNVWNTCMVFFQACLLLGYLYAHKSISLLGIKKQSLIHLLLLLLGLLTLPVVIPDNWSAPSCQNPIPDLILLMIRTIGIPFFLLSSTAPMLQRWFSCTGHSTSKDPYFLYAASNAGSILGLLSYPFIVEPILPLSNQTALWRSGYIVMIVLIGIRAVSLLLINKNNKAEHDLETKLQSKENNLPARTKIKWILLSLVPSSLMLGVTTFISSEIAAVPLLWVVPLFIYLVTFILVFAKKMLFSHKLMIRLMPAVIIITTISMLFNKSVLTLLCFAPHLLLLFIVSMVCHGELAKTRPSVSFLTQFYLCISLGGFLGGFFNSIIAPLVFKTVLEYPLIIICSCLLMPNINIDIDNDNSKNKKYTTVFDILFPAAIFLYIILLWNLLSDKNIRPEWIKNFFVVIAPCILCYTFAKRPLRFALGICALMLSTNLISFSMKKILITERSFFGVHKIMHNSLTNINYLINGKTIHGAQSTLEANKDEPLTYYHKKSPIGQLFGEINETNKDKNLKIAVVGLGAGSLISYGAENQEWTFYEIDPLVKKIAEDKRFFTYLHDSKCKYKIILGDARLSLKDAPEKYFDLIVLDAFSSDSIPLHLLTKEAVELYSKKITDNGILAFHISNIYLNLWPLLGNLADYFKMFSIVQVDTSLTQDDISQGKRNSIWALMTRDKINLGKLVFDPRWMWRSSEKNPQIGIWSDDYSNIFSLIRWR